MDRVDETTTDLSQYEAVSKLSSLDSQEFSRAASCCEKLNSCEFSYSGFAELQLPHV